MTYSDNPLILSETSPQPRPRRHRPQWPTNDQSAAQAIRGLAQCGCTPASSGVGERPSRGCDRRRHRVAAPGHGFAAPGHGFVGIITGGTKECQPRRRQYSTADIHSPSIATLPISPTANYRGRLHRAIEANSTYAWRHHQRLFGWFRQSDHRSAHVLHADTGGCLRGGFCVPAGIPHRPGHSFRPHTTLRAPHYLGGGFHFAAVLSGSSRTLR